jgi:hypothetical protein
VAVLRFKPEKLKALKRVKKERERENGSIIINSRLE